MTEHTDTAHVVELTGDSETIDRFIDVLRHEATALDEIETPEPGSRLFRVAGVDPTFDIEREGFDGLEISPRAFEPGFLLRMVRIQHEPPPELGESSEDWNDHVLSLVSEEIERLGGEVTGTNNVARGEVPVAATAPTDQGVVVGAVAVSVRTPLLLDGVGIVRVDELGVVRVNPRQEGEWSGPFLRS